MTFSYIIVPLSVYHYIYIKTHHSLDHNRNHYWYIKYNHHLINNYEEFFPKFRF